MLVHREISKLKICLLKKSIGLVDRGMVSPANKAKRRDWSVKIHKDHGLS